MNPQDLRDLMEAYGQVYEAKETTALGGRLIDPYDKAPYSDDPVPSDYKPVRKMKKMSGVVRKEEFENWVSEFVEEGYDLSDFTWDEMYEFYLDEEISSERGKAKAAEMIAKRTTASGRARPGQGANVATIKHIRRSNRDGLLGTPPNPKVAGSNWPKSYSGVGGTGNKAARRAAALKKEDLDIFDVVLEFLCVEGYAETLEEAEWMMTNFLDEEAIDIIIGEEQLDEVSDRLAKAARNTRERRYNASFGDGGMSANYSKQNAKKNMLNKTLASRAERTGSKIKPVEEDYVNEAEKPFPYEKVKAKQVKLRDQGSAGLDRRMKMGMAVRRAKEAEKTGGSQQDAGKGWYHAKEDYVNEAQHARENPEKYEREQAKKSAPVRGERTPMPPRGDKRREDFEKWYAKQMGEEVSPEVQKHREDRAKRLDYKDEVRSARRAWIKKVNKGRPEYEGVKEAYQDPKFSRKDYLAKLEKRGGMGAGTKEDPHGYRDPKMAKVGAEFSKRVTAAHKAKKSGEADAYRAEKEGQSKRK